MNHTTLKQSLIAVLSLLLLVVLTAMTVTSTDNPTPEDPEATLAETEAPILIRRTVNVRFGRLEEAASESKAIAAYLNERIPRLRARAYSDVIDMGYRLHFFFSVESLGDYEALGAELSEDPAYEGRLQNLWMSDAFVDGSLRSVTLSALQPNTVGDAAILVERSAKVRYGHFQAAQQWATKITNYINEHYPSRNARVYTETVGNLATIHWLVNYESLAEMDTYVAKLAQDKGYMDLIQQAREALLFESDIHDTVLAAL